MLQSLLSTPKPSKNVRFNRLNKTVELRKHSTSEIGTDDTIKLAAMSSIKKGVKHNDVSFLTERGLGKLRKDPEQSGDLLLQNADANLKKIRCKYDKTRSQNQILEKQVRKLTQQVRKYRKAEEQFVQQKDDGSENVKQLTQGVNSKTYQFSEKDVEKKVLQHMKQRYNKDKVFLDQRKFDLEKELKFLRKQGDLIKNDGKSIVQQYDRSKKLYQKLVQAINEQKGQRMQHLKSVESIIEQKRQVTLVSETISHQTRQIAQRALQDKDQTQKNWEKLYLAQKMVAKMLSDKMNKQMEKFGVVQTAFKNIKIATGVNESGALIYKFLNKQTVYGQLLQRIAENETRIVSLKLESEQLYKEQKQLDEQQKELNQMRRKDTITLNKQLKLLQEFEQRRQNNELQQNKMRLWLLKNLKKFKLLGQPLETLTINNLQDIKAILQKYLGLLSKTLEQANEETSDILQSQFTPKMVQKMYRIRMDSKRKNSVGEEIDLNFEEERIANPEQELQSVEQSWVQVHKNNEKFMKMLKLKYEEIRRARVEAMPKQKKIELPKPKIQQPVQ